ncbi:type 2 glycerol-3-phosphate oxidase [Mycoplasma sp. 1654_15]|uniref:type 2 glycerol-3-phosphate oxidase n=1 Tax=Mycoplasma sp. 1654_15 TaxID=2725994 RepID=UPI001449F4AD|nr:type 2 glycerol-3-phosphate oxidase [Mycoplasma sp. 1654_15]QJB71341.1 type 2 glycerol-3-phosphate oxidase [Mycoplasma sp. 1654_15]
MKTLSFDVLIIGSGIVGSTIAYELSKYKIKLALLEKNPSFANETTATNSGIIHCGYDAEPNTLKAKLNVIGNKLWQEKIFTKIKFPRKQADSVVIAFDEQEKAELQHLYNKGIQNNLNPKALKILDEKATKKQFPNLNPLVIGSLVCANSWIIDPQKASLAFLQVAKNNQAQLFENTKVEKIEFKNNFFFVQTNKQDVEFKAKVVINASGIFADEIAKLAGFAEFEQRFLKGQYLILPSVNNKNIESIFFMTPTKYGKGVIVTKKLDGTIMVGPTAQEHKSREQAKTLNINLIKKIQEIGQKIFPELDFSDIITTYAASRSIDVATNDFIIKSADENPSFINVAGMQSPALSSAPAIAKEVKKLVLKAKISLVLKEDFTEKAEIL